MSLEIPQTVAELTTDYLNGALAGVLGGGVISAVRCQDIGVGVGVFGIITRLHLTVDGGSGAPATVIAKMPTDAEANRNVGLILKLYERENRFYDDIAPTVTFRVPQCYLSVSNAEAGEFLLLLEDLGHMEAGDQLAGLAPLRAISIIDGLAAFHATWWESDTLASLDWLPAQDAPIYVAAVPPIVSAGVAALPPLVADLPAGSLEMARKVDANFVDILHRCAAGPRTFVHGDARLDNLFFVDGTDDFALIDWQLSLRCRGIYDVVWLLATSMDPAEQNANTENLLRRYHRSLGDNGVVWDFDDLRKAATEQAAYLLSGPLSLIGTFDFSEAGDGRAAALTKKWVARGFNLALLLGVGELFD